MSNASETLLRSWYFLPHCSCKTKRGASCRGLQQGVCTLALPLIHEVLLDDDVAAEALADEA